MPRRGAGGLPPIRKSLGQHFLTDPRILTRIVDALDPRNDETIIEIGAGRGAMTEILRARAGRVIAIEYDRALAALLRERYANTNVQIIEADVLMTDLAAIAAGPFAVIGNVPYYITTPILFHALRRPRASRAVFLVQREVADRMTASAGSRNYGALSVNLQALAAAETMFGVPAGAFKPPPKVESAVVRVVPRAEPVITTDEEEGFREFVQGVFGMRRKQMRRVLRGLFSLSADDAESVLAAAGIQPDARPETLSPPLFADLHRRILRR
jgi:16S rRNA (adenine1518-N6/adenine1519-N6)-dimethyltransferase